MKIISILYSIITLPIFGLIDFILLPVLKYTILVLKAISTSLDDFNYIVVKINTRLAIKSGRTKCNHYTATFVSSYENRRDNKIVRTYKCDMCRKYIQTFEVI